MKCLKYLTAAAVLLCSGTVSAQQSTAVKLLKPLLEHQCKAELKDSKLWKASTFLMEDANKQKFEQEVCGCVSDNALNDVGIMEIAQAMLTEEAKNALVRKAVMNSVKGCIVQTKR